MFIGKERGGYSLMHIGRQTVTLRQYLNGLVFNLQLSKGLNGQIQVSTNLTDWTTLTNFVGTNTTLNFRDLAATNSSRRFYRAVIP